MSHRFISRRGLLKGALAAAGAAVGTKLGGGPLVRTAHAAGEPAHLVFIFLPGGLNACIAGVAQPFVTGAQFGMAQGNVTNIGGGVTTDSATFGQLPDFAKQHWAAIGCKHGVTSHTTPDNNNGGGERVMTRRGNNSYLTQLAQAMGGDSALKAVHLGDYPAYRTMPAAGDVSMQRITDLDNAIKALGAGPPNPNAPDRAISAAGINAAQKISQPQITANAKSLLSMNEAYGAGVAALSKPAPPPVTFPEISQAYGLNNATAVTGFASQLAGAEVMIRAASSNVISVFDNGFVGWDFHQVSGGVSQNMIFSRNRMTGAGRFDDRLTPLITFMNRMLNLPDRNVVVAVSGDFVRVPNGDHGDGTITAVFGKYVKQGVSFPCSGNARFATGTPGVEQTWAAIAAALKIPQNPFGANPHPIV